MTDGALIITMTVTVRGALALFSGAGQYEVIFFLFLVEKNGCYRYKHRLGLWPCAGSPSPGDGQPPSLLTGACDSEEGRPGHESVALLSQSTYMPLVVSSAPRDQDSPALLLHHEVVWPAAMGEFFFFPSMFAV